MKDIPAILGGSPVRRRPFPPHPLLGREEMAAVKRVVRSGVLSGFLANPGPAFLGGPRVLELEHHFKKFFRTGHAVAMNSATAALHAALLAIGVEPGDEVIVPPYTMSASAAAILMCGAIPVFVDVEIDSYGLDPRKIEERISPRTKAILVVHLFGHPAKIKAIMKIAKERRLRVVEDCAQAPAARDGDRFVGTFGDVGVFSLNQNKTITTGEGGVAVTDDKKLALRLRLVRNHGEVVKDHIPEARDIDILGWNYRFTELEASVGVEQFKKLKKLNAWRVRLADRLTQKLEGLPGLTLPNTRPGSSHVYFVYPVRYEKARTGLSRDLFVEAVRAEGVPIGAGYVRPIYLDSIYQRKRIYSGTHFPFDRMSKKNKSNFERGSCPVTEELHFESLVTIGVCRYPVLPRDIDDVARAIQKVIHHAASIRKKREKKP